MEIEPVARIVSNFEEKFGIPRQSGLSEGISTIVFEPKYRDPDALRGLEGFSHIWLIFDFSETHVDPEKWPRLVRPPRLGGNRSVGVFSSRSPFRPNSLGLSSVRLVSIESTDAYGTVLKVKGADLMNGTPIYDIKPYIRFSDSHEDAVCGFVDTEPFPTMNVTYDEGMLDVFTEEQRKELLSCLEQDPRPAYHDDLRSYGMSFAGYNIRFTARKDTLRVVSVQKRK